MIAEESVQEGVLTLKSRHAELEAALEKEKTRPHPDQTEIHQLKKRKLRIKDQLLRMGAA